MSLSATMQLIAGSTLTLPAPVPGSIRRTPLLVQNRVVSASGGLFVDDKGVTRYRVEFDVMLTDAQAQAFDTFYRTVAAGSLNTFTWLDHENRSWGGCRFDFESEPTLTRDASRRHALTIRLLTSGLFGT